MKEIEKYNVLKEKLQGICDEHNLTYSIECRQYPFFMIIKPLGGVDAQQTMLEGMDEAGDTGYISPDASLVFAYRDGELSYKISETWTISATLFNKLKNLFMKLRDMWMAYFFWDIHEHSPGAAERTDNSLEDTEDSAPAEDGTDLPVDEEDPFGEFLGEAAPAAEDEDAEEATPEDAGDEE